MSSQNNVSCNGFADGDATINVFNGTPPYSYNWNTIPVQTAQTATGLSAGAYIVTVTDAAGCTLQQQVVITQPMLLTCVTSSAASQCGLNNGSASVVAAGGTAPYTYLWNNGATTATINSLAAGTYSVTVTDANGCTTSCTEVVQGVGVLSCVPTSTNVTCFGGNDGTATVGQITGGTPPYSYLWSTVPAQTTNMAVNLSAGTYTVVITDAFGCSKSVTVTVSEPPAFSCNATVIIEPGCDDLNGVANVSASGGTAPYTYSWNTVPVQTMQTATGLSSGTYTATVTDANGCTTTCVVTLTGPSPIVFGTPTIVDATCSDGSDGSATLNISGGTPPYMYNWSNGQTTQTATGLAMGTYVVTITDSLGCTLIDTASVIVGSPTPLVLSLTDSAEICSVDSDLSPYVHGQFFFDQWAGITVTGQANVSGVDTIIVFDSDTTGTMDPDLEVGIGPILIIPQDIIDSNGDNIVDDPDDNQFGGTMTFLFDECVTINSFQFVDQDINTLPVVTAYDSLGNVITSVLVPNMGDGSVQTIALNAACVSKLEIFSSTSYGVGGFDLDCSTVQGGCVNGSVDLTVSGGTPAYTYLWSNGATTEDLNGVPCATYTVTVTDNNGCTMTRSITITPNTVPIQCSVQGANASACGQGNNGSATIQTVTGGVAPYSYLWNTVPAQTGATATGTSSR